VRRRQASTEKQSTRPLFEVSLLLSFISIAQLFGFGSLLCLCFVFMLFVRYILGFWCVCVSVSSVPASPFYKQAPSYSRPGVHSFGYCCCRLSE